MSDYAKDHSPKRGNKVGVVVATPGAANGIDHAADINQSEGNSGMNVGADTKDAKHHTTARANALDTWKRGVSGGHRADGSGSVSNQETGHRPYHKPNPGARANGLAMWQEGVDSKHSELGEHAVPEQFNNRHNAK
jgi:hypothetical protein